MAICPKCGASASDAARFCTVCGAAMAAVPALTLDPPQTEALCAEPGPPVFAPAEEPLVPDEEPVVSAEEPLAPDEEPAAPDEEPAAPDEEPAAPAEEAQSEEAPAVREEPVGEFAAPAPEQTPPPFTAIPEPPRAPEPPVFTPPAYTPPAYTPPQQPYHQPAQTPPYQPYQQPGYAAPQPAYSAPKLSPDAEENRYLCVFAYMGVMALLPAVLKPGSAFVRYHVNQGLALFLFVMMCGVCCIVPLLGWLVGGLGMIFAVVCEIIGIVRSCKGQMKPLPLIGGWRILR